MNTGRRKEESGIHYVHKVEGIYTHSNGSECEIGISNEMQRNPLNGYL